MVGAGAVVTNDVPPNAIVKVNPARITGYVNSTHLLSKTEKISSSEKDLTMLSVNGAFLNSLPIIKDLRGALAFGEYDKHLPFIPKRFFVIFDVPTKEIRGEHAHKKCHQFLVCIKGACSVLLDDGKTREEILLDTPTIGLHILPMVWGVQYKYTNDAVLMVLASDEYDADDYIRNYDQFLNLVYVK